MIHRGKHLEKGERQSKAEGLLQRTVRWREKRSLKRWLETRTDFFYILLSPINNNYKMFSSWLLWLPNFHWPQSSVILDYKSCVVLQYTPVVCHLLLHHYLVPLALTSCIFFQCLITCLSLHFLPFAIILLLFCSFFPTVSFVIFSNVLYLSYLSSIMKRVRSWRAEQVNTNWSQNWSDGWTEYQRFSRLTLSIIHETRRRRTELNIKLWR